MYGLPGTHTSRVALLLCEKIPSRTFSIPALCYNLFMRKVQDVPASKGGVTYG